MLPRSPLGRALERRRGGRAGHAKAVCTRACALYAWTSATELRALVALHVGVRHFRLAVCAHVHLCGQYEQDIT